MLDYRGHARLLQHDLRKPDAVGIVVSRQGRSRAMRVIPGEKAAAKRRSASAAIDVLRSRCSFFMIQHSSTSSQTRPYMEVHPSVLHCISRRH